MEKKIRYSLDSHDFKELIEGRIVYIENSIEIALNDIGLSHIRNMVHDAIEKTKQ